MREIEYSGRNDILKKLAKETSISQESFDIVRVIGPKKFIKLVKKGELRQTIMNQYLEWIVNAPELVLADLEAEYKKQFDGDFDLELASKKMGFNYVKYLIDLAPEWLEDAPKMLRNILDVTIQDTHSVMKHDENDYCTLRPGNMAEVFNDYLGEATEYLGYIGAV